MKTLIVRSILLGLLCIMFLALPLWLFHFELWWTDVLTIVCLMCAVVTGVTAIVDAADARTESLAKQGMKLTRAETARLIKGVDDYAEEE